MEKSFYLFAMMRKCPSKHLIFLLLNTKSILKRLNKNDKEEINLTGLFYKPCCYGKSDEH